jgi:hypothetical protein
MGQAFYSGRNDRQAEMTVKKDKAMFENKLFNGENDNGNQ